MRHILPILPKKLTNLTRPQFSYFIKIGFCQQKFYKPSVWSKAKVLMEQIAVASNLAYPHDYGRGKGKFESDLTIDEVCNKSYDIYKLHMHL